MNVLLNLASTAVIAYLILRFERERYARKCDSVARDWERANACGRIAAQDCARSIRQSSPWH